MLLGILDAMDGYELRRRREALGWSQEKLAGLLAVPQATISRWEAGKHKIEHARMLELALRTLEREPDLEETVLRIGGLDVEQARDE